VRPKGDVGSLQWKDHRVAITFTADVVLGRGPSGLAVAPDGVRAYVTDGTDGTIHVVALATMSVVATIPIPDNSPVVDHAVPFAVAFAPNGDRAYVVGIIAGGFRIVDTASLTLTDAQLGGPVGVRSPLGIAISPNGRTAYVCDPIIGEIQPVDLEQLKTVLPMINADDSASFKVTINPAGTFLYGMSEGGCTIVPINLDTQMFVRPPIVINCDSADLCSTPDGRHLLIANRTALLAPEDSSLSVIDTATNKLLGPEIRLGLADGSRVGGIALSPDGATTYLIRRNEDAKVGNLCSLPTADIFSSISVS